VIFYQAPGTTFKDNLFPWLREELGPLTDLHKRVIVTSNSHFGWERGLSKGATD
jgi:hypothetical protein